ncbi:MAG: hypothetical protein RLN60_02555 [Phycisphaerales bacterium]
MLTLTLAFVLAVSAAALAGEEVKVDSRVILNDLASIYRDAPQTEDLRVTVVTAIDRRVERMTVRTVPGRGAEIRLGPLTLWTDLSSWFATHKDLPGCYTRVPIAGPGVIGTLDAHFPRLLVPQIVWMTSEGHVNDLCAYTAETTWTTGTILSPRMATPNDIVSTATAVGRSEAFEITVTMESTVDMKDRLGFIRLESAEGLSILVQRLDHNGPIKSDLGVPIDGRERLASFDALLARLPEAIR